MPTYKEEGKYNPGRGEKSIYWNHHRTNMELADKDNTAVVITVSHMFKKLGGKISYGK